MKKLTKREKTLLYALAVIVITAGMVYFAILPQTALRDMLDETVSEREMELATMQNALATRDAVEKDIADAQARIEVRSGKYLSPLTSDDTDRYITGLLQQNGLTAESLTITASGYAQSAASIGAVRVSVGARGGFEQYISLMQQVHDTDGIRVSDFAVRFGGYTDVLDEEATAAAIAAAEETAKAEAAKSSKNKKKTDAAAAAEAEPIQVMKQVPYYTATIGFELLCYDKTLGAAEAALETEDVQEEIG